jgi:4a-hydroxytetrahydrobiopterin dehydratase
VSRPALLDQAVVDEWLAKHPSWRIDEGHLVREIVTRDYPSSVRLLGAQIDLAETLDHHPIVTLGYRTLRFELWTHDRDGLTRLDLDYAQGLDEIIAASFGGLVV